MLSSQLKKVKKPNACGVELLGNKKFKCPSILHLDLVRSL